MREIVFDVVQEDRGHIAAATARGLRVEANSLEALHHEVRDALIASLGPAHATYRIRIRRRGRPHAAAPASAAGQAS
jgi:hypothetical protein